MKADIHPQLHEARVSCSACGTEFVTLSTRPEIRVEVCSNCHPFFTGKQARIVDTEGRVEKFMRKFEGQETRVSKRKRKLEAAAEARRLQQQREAEAAAKQVAEEKARREEARRKRAEEQAARRAAQEAAAAKAEATEGPETEMASPDSPEQS